MFCKVFEFIRIFIVIYEDFIISLVLIFFGRSLIFRVLVYSKNWDEYVGD